MTTARRKQHQQLNYLPFRFDEELPAPDFQIVEDCQLAEFRVQFDKLSYDELWRCLNSFVGSLIARQQASAKNPKHPYLIYPAALMTEYGFELLRQSVQSNSSSAANMMTGFLRRAVKLINDERKRDPDLFQDVMQRSMTFPVLYSPHQDFATPLAGLDAALGANQPLKWQSSGKKRAKRKSLATKAHWLAIRLYSTVDRNWSRLRLDKPEHVDQNLPDWVKQCAKLAPFTAKTADSWFAAGWPAIEEALQSDPKMFENFQSIGFCRATKGGSRNEISADQRKKKIIGGIKEKVRNALRSWSRSPQKPA